MRLNVAAKDEGPSSASVTLHVAAGTEPLGYDAPPVTPLIPIEGAVFGGGETLTVNSAGPKVNVPPVVLEVWATVIVVEPAETGVIVSVFMLPHAENVALGEMLTVATATLLELTETPSVVDPVRLQPGFPSPPVGFT